MIVHRYQDGSEDYEYEVGDVVEITGVIPSSAWFARAIGRVGPIVEITPYTRGKPCRHTNSLYVRDRPDWGPSHCKPWQVKPTPDTSITRTVVAPDTPPAPNPRKQGA